MLDSQHANKAVSAGKTIVVLSSNEMGVGESELGKILIKNFIFSLTQMAQLPDTILVYNTGAKLVIKDSAVFDDLAKLSQLGVKVMTCGTCLNYFGLTETLAVGEITNMYTVVDEMRTATHVLKP